VAYINALGEFNRPHPPTRPPKPRDTATDPETGRARGYGHIEFATAAAALKAQETCHGADFGGRDIKVDATGNRPPPKAGAGGEDGTVFVKGFDTSAGEDAARKALQGAFGACGEIVRLRMPCDRESGALKGFAYIEFKEVAAKAKAAALDGSEIGGARVKVDINVAPRTPGGGAGGGDGGGNGYGGGSGGGRFGGGHGGGGGRFGGRGGRGGREGGRSGGRGGERGGMRIDVGGGSGKKMKFDD
jgi:nucleolin